MVAASKVFEDPLNCLNCAGFVHSLPNQSCTEALIWNLYRNHVSSAKYYFPILLFPLLYHYRRLNKQRVIALLKNYAQIVTSASVLNAVTFFMMCVFRRLFGRYIWGLTPYLACFIGAQVLWFTPPKVKQFYATGIIHAGVEGIFRQLDLIVVHSQAARMLVFMICSLVILRKQQQTGSSGFWFIKPSKLPEDYTKWSLVQRAKEALLELRTYLGIGLTMDLISAAVRKQLPKMSLKSTSFMVSYIGIYRLIQCVLAGKLEERHVNPLAAFLSGTSFWFVSHTPLTLMSLSLVLATQVLWKEFCAVDVSSHKFLAFLQRLPWTLLLVPHNVAYLVHSYMFQDHVVNGVARSFINRTCDDNAQRLCDMLKLPEHKILEISRISKMPFFF